MNNLDYLRKNLFFTTAVLLTFVGAVVWQLNCPLCADDYVFSLAHEKNSPYNQDSYYSCQGENYQNVDDVMFVLVNHTLHSSSRISNSLYILFQFLPAWVVRSICGLSIGFMFLGILLLGVPREKRNNPWILIILTFAFWFLLPWDDGMQSAVFCFNYPIASCFLLLWLYLYERIDSFGRKGFCLFIAYTLFFSVYHEGASILALAYVFCQLIFGNVNSKKFRWIAFGMLLFGLTVTALLGTGNRIDNTYFMFNCLSSLYRWEKINILLNVSFVLFSIAFSAIVWRKLSENKSLLKNDILPLVAVVFISMTIAVCLNSFGRTLWFGDIFALILILKLCAFLVRKLDVSKIESVIFFAFAALYAGWLGCLVYWQRQITSRDNALSQKLTPRRSSTTPIVYVDWLHRGDVPWFLWDIPSPEIEKTPFASNVIAKYWISKENKNSIFILPEKYEGHPVDSVKLYPGNARARGDWPFIFLDRPYCGGAVVKLGDFSDSLTPMRLVNTLKKSLFGSVSDDMYLFIETDPQIYNDSTTVHIVENYLLPRTFRGRPVVQIDTLP